LQLARLSAAEQRQKLLDWLRADLCNGQAHDRDDPKWKMPALTSDGRTTDAGPTLQFVFRECNIGLSDEGLMQLRRACRLAFALDGSSWMPCKGAPRCFAESIALAIFEHHTQGAHFDPAKSGAEWWGQVRNSGDVEEGIQCHWDTDEAAVERDAINIHPHLSTVTYLTDCGAPTLIVDRRNPLKADDVPKAVYGRIKHGLLSPPSIGKHVVFDGQLLHGTAPQVGGLAAGQRVTFLVNVWLNHRPSNCYRLRKSMALRLGGQGLSLQLTPLKPVAKSLKDPAEVILETTFGRCHHEHKLSVPLPCSLSETAVLDWSSGAELKPLE